MKKIGVFVGVFNPPHNFHFAIAQEILDSDPDFEKIIFVPTGNKYNKLEIIDAEHRFNMLNLICKNNPKFEVSRIEIEQEEQLYTYQTLNLISKEYNNYKIILIIGSDNLKSFNTWREYKYILTTYSPIVYNRGTDSLSLIIENSDFLSEFKNSLSTINFPIYTNLNSSLIRKKVANSQTITYLVPEAINKYIIDNNLYNK